MVVYKTISSKIKKILLKKLQETFEDFLLNLSDVERIDFFGLLVNGSSSSFKLMQAYLIYQNKVLSLIEREEGIDNLVIQGKKNSFFTLEIMLEALPTKFTVPLIMSLNPEDIKKVFHTKEYLVTKTDFYHLNPRDVLEVYNHLGKELIDFYQLDIYPLTRKGPDVFNEIWDKLSHDIKNSIRIPCGAFFCLGFEGKTILFLSNFKHRLIHFNEILDAFLYPDENISFRKYLPSNNDVLMFLEIIGSKRLLEYIKMDDAQKVLSRLIKLINFFPTPASRYKFIISCEYNELKKIIDLNSPHFKKILDLFFEQKEQNEVI